MDKLDRKKVFDDDPYKDYIKGEDGKYHYAGNVYLIDMPKEEVDSLCKKLWLLIIVAALLWFACGLLPFKGLMYSFYCVLPFCGGLLALLMIFRAMFTFSNSRYALTEKDFHRSIENFTVYGVLMMIIAVAGIVCAIIYVVNNGFDGDMLFFIIYLLVCVVTILIMLKLKKIVDKLEFDIEDRSVKI